VATGNRWLDGRDFLECLPYLLTCGTSGTSGCPKTLELIKPNGAAVLDKDVTNVRKQHYAIIKTSLNKHDVAHPQRDVLFRGCIFALACNINTAAAWPHDDDLCAGVYIASAAAL